MLTNGQMTDDRQIANVWLYYKLTYEPKGSGELKKKKEKLFTSLLSCYTMN